jgi:hypothetical protein
MNVALAQGRLLGVVAVVGSALGLAMMLPLLMQGAIFRAIDQLALLSVVALYGYGIWSGVDALKARPGWRVHARYFWLAQVPYVSSSFVTLAVSCGAGAWLYVRAGGAGLGAGAAAYVGSAYQWSYMQHKPEVLLGVNALALAIAGWLSFPSHEKVASESNAV